MPNPEIGPTPAQLEEYVELRENYAPSEETRLRNKGKTLIAMTGPSGSGKSRLSNEVVLVRPDIVEVGTITTRNGRPNDPSTFISGAPFERVLQHMRDRELLNVSLFGTNLYGTLADGFGRMSIGPITADSVPALRDGGFDKFMVAYPVVDQDVFREVLIAERLALTDISARLKEGIESTEFALDSLDEPWFYAIENSHEKGGVQKAAEQIIAIAENRGEGLQKNLAEKALIDMRSVLIELKKN